MEDYQKRVVQEKQELDEKISKLGVFIYGNQEFHKLSNSQKDLLIDQLKIMEKYSNILRIRIETFG